MTTPAELEHDRVQQWYADMCKTGPEPPMNPQEFRGLYGNVVTADCYGLRTLDFKPDVILDIGANVGGFTRFARSLFPSALIVCVEPDARNLAFLKHLTEDHNNMVFLNKAIGRGVIFRTVKRAINGAHEFYHGNGSPVFAALAKDNPRYEPLGVEPVMLDELAATYCPEGARLLVKIDIESAERIIFEHPASMAVLSNADYFAMELHVGHKLDAPPLDIFQRTHRMSQVHSEMRARKL